MRQIETFLLQRHYDGFLKKGRVRARSGGQARPGALGDAASKEAVTKLLTVVGSIFFFGIAIWLWRQYSGQ